MEVWTATRFLLYPLMLVLGVALALLFYRSYQAHRLPCQAWAMWLAVAAAAQGAFGLLALLLSRLLGGFSGSTSAVFTAGVALVVVVLLSAVLSLGLAAWREGR